MSRLTQLTNLTQGQKAIVAAALEPMYAEAAKQRMLAGKKDPEADLPQGTERAQQAREQAAKAVGASGRGVSQAKAIQRDAPDLVDKVVNGARLVDIHSCCSPVVYAGNVPGALARAALLR